MRIFLVNWYGPFTDAEIATRSLRKVLNWPALAENGLYMLVGKRKYQKKLRIQYIGISQTTFAQRFANHEKKDLITRDAQVWLGKIGTYDDALRSELELVEHALLAFSDETPLNERKKRSYPAHSCAVISRFFSTEGRIVTAERQACFEAVPDVLLWDKSTPQILHYATSLETYEFE